MSMELSNSSVDYVSKNCSTVSANCVCVCVCVCQLVGGYELENALFFSSDALPPRQSTFVTLFLKFDLFSFRHSHQSRGILCKRNMPIIFDI